MSGDSTKKYPYISRLEFSIYEGEILWFYQLNTDIQTDKKNRVYHHQTFGHDYSAAIAALKEVISQFD